MRQLVNTIDYNTTISLAQNMNGTYDNSVTFHCYWYGTLNEKHLYSIMSCYYFNVRNNKHNIILWIENNQPNNFNKEIEKYAEIRVFSLNNESIDTPFHNYNHGQSSLTYISDYIRSLLLYKYGGCWFDLDCFFLRSFDPIFAEYKNHICLYQWEATNFPNNAIYISLEPRSDKLLSIMNYIIKRNRGWGCAQAQLTYDLDIDYLVLPCSWFDAGWIPNIHNNTYATFFNNTNHKFTLDTFHKGSFCYHWHNKWNNSIHPNSIMMQLVTEIIAKLST